MLFRLVDSENWEIQLIATCNLQRVNAVRKGGPIGHILVKKCVVCCDPPGTVRGGVRHSCLVSRVSSLPPSEMRDACGHDP